MRFVNAKVISHRIAPMLIALETCRCHKWACFIDERVFSVACHSRYRDGLWNHSVLPNKRIAGLYLAAENRIWKICL
jgi:hypothetical protein